MVMNTNEAADYAAVFNNEEGEYVTVELPRSIETISDGGIGKMLS